MRKCSIFVYTDTFILKPASKARKYNNRLISLFITMIHSFILARQRIFLNVLVSMHPHKNSSISVMNILKKGGIKNNAYYNFIIHRSYTQFYRFKQTIVYKPLGLCFYRGNSNFYIKENCIFEPLIVDSKLPL